MGLKSGVEYPRDPSNPLRISTVVAKLFLVQKGICFHCNKPMLWAQARKGAFISGKIFTNGWSREHVIPWSRGGRNNRNIVLAHAPCNTKRGVEAFSVQQMERAENIWAAVDKLSMGAVGEFLKDRTIVGTYAHHYDWPIDVGEPKFIP